MKYRTRLYLSLLGIAFLCSGVGLGVMYYETHRFLWTELKSKAMSVSATTAAVIDPSLFQEIKTRADENSTAYSLVIKTLRKIRDANRRSDINVTSLYALRPNPLNPKELIFIVDAEEIPLEAGYTGQIDAYNDAAEITDHLDEYYSPPQFISDQWGTFLTAFAPVKDSAGNYVATIATDIDSSQIKNLLFQLNLYGLLGILGSLLLSIWGAHVLSRRVSVSLHYLCNAMEEIEKGNLNYHADLHTKDEFEDLAHSINHMTTGLKERERMKMNFVRYVSKHVLDAIIKSDTPTKLEGERRKITVLFSDIRHFTRLAEHLPPEQVVSLLNEFFAVMLDIVFAHEGTFDKFLGDGIMVEFGAPLEDPLQEQHAILTALEMQKALTTLCTRWEKENKPQIAMGIGIHTGLAVVGNIGSEKRMEYTAIGDTVNVAARLEQATKALKIPILVSESTYIATKHLFKMTDLGKMTLEGRKEPIRAYSIIPELPTE